MNGKENIKFICKKCDKTFGSKSSYKRHKKDKHSKTKYLIKCEQCEYKVREGRQHDLKKHIERVHTKRLCAPKIRTCTEMPQHPMIFQEIHRNAITNAEENSTTLLPHRYIPTEAHTEPPATSSLQTFRTTSLSSPIIGPTLSVQIENDQTYPPLYEDISNDGTPTMDEQTEMEPTQNTQIIFMENNMPQIEDPIDTLKNDLLLSEDEEDKAETPEELDTEDLQIIIYPAAQDTIHTATQEENIEPTEDKQETQDTATINQAITDALHSPPIYNNEASNTDKPSPRCPAKDDDVEHIHLQQVPDGLRFNILCRMYTNQNGVMRLELLMPDGTNPNNCPTQ